MKKLMLLSFIAAFMAAPSFAQETKVKDKQNDYSEWQKKITTELKLTADQIEKWDAINKECKEKIEALKTDASMNEEAQKARKMELKKEKEAKFVELLTPDQQAMYKAMLENKKKEAEAKKPSGN